MGLTNEQYHEIIREYETRQFNNRKALEDRSRHVHLHIPELKALEDDITSTSASCVRLALGDDSSELDTQKQRLEALRQKKSELLQRAGFNRDYLDMHYTCPDCKDTGFIGNERCHCFKQAAINLIYEQSNLGANFSKETFSNFSFDYYDKEHRNEATGLTAYDTAKNAFTCCRDFVQTFDSKYQNLFIYGNTGVGKTFLSNCIAHELLNSGHSVIYLTAFELFDIFEKKVFQHDTSQQDSYENIFSCDLLIIDDLGTEMSNSFTVSQLYLCLNERLLRKKSTIISTNLGLKEFDDIYTERTFSRMFSNYTVIKLFGEDIRIKKKLQ